MKKPGLFHYRQWLRQKYIDENLSIREIANMCRVDHTTIFYYLRKFGLDVDKKINAPMEQIHLYLPQYLLESLRDFSDLKKQPIRLIIQEVMMNHLLEKKFNPFVGRKFKEKNV